MGSVTDGGRYFGHGGVNPTFSLKISPKKHSQNLNSALDLKLKSSDFFFTHRLLGLTEVAQDGTRLVWCHPSLPTLSSGGFTRHPSTVSFCPRPRIRHYMLYHDVAESFV